VQTDRLGPVLAVAGEVERHFIEAHHVLPTHRGDGQRHGLVRAGLLPGAGLPLLADDRFAGSHGNPLPPLAPSWPPKGFKEGAPCRIMGLDNPAFSANPEVCRQL